MYSGARLSMHSRSLLLRSSLFLSAVFLLYPSRAAGQTSGPAAVPASHDGSHDFDWIIGNWHATLRRLVKPLTGSTTWVARTPRSASLPTPGPRPDWARALRRRQK